ncbi:hypothetical protein SAMN05878443_0783 [Carnobacterium alterfunditum]|uniref:Uncharacterized protein n=1 Tax=Carnobacterium alterfunditum TaxID=28230 RepID=A0A1N6FRF5_9LACT|nr:hypothetical protein [Carnobacterium alterfunditum]SIN97906.1 hypothetical protein SAMN05878443_0783 [Carnobacterium alterfunditum]
MEYGQKLKLEDVNCSNCGGQVRGEAKCKQCEKEIIYGEEVAVFLEHEGYTVDPTHRTMKSYKHWYIENGKKNSTIYRIGDALEKGGKSLGNVSKSTNSIANSMLGLGCLVFVVGILLLLLIFII